MHCVKSLYKIVSLQGYIGVIYRSPRQNIEFGNFLQILRTTTSSNGLFTMIIGNFNARPSVWWTKDKTTTERTQLESLTIVHGFQQLISKPTHLLPQSSSCNDLIFTDQPNLIVDSGVHCLYIQTATIRLCYLHTIYTYLFFSYTYSPLLLENKKLL